MTQETLQQEDTIGKEEHASVVQIIQTMVKTSKALRIYLPNNPVLIGFISELGTRMTVHLARYGELSLEVDPFALHCQGAKVYENTDPKESIASRLYADGIRALFFDQGVQSAELTAFLGIAGFDRTSNDDDIVTQLWERNLQHIGYLTEEDFRDGAPSEEAGTSGDQREALGRIRQALAEQPPPAPRMIPKHLLMLNVDEEKWLQGALEAEGRCSGLEDVIGVLAATVAGTRDPELYRDFIAMMETLAVTLLLAGDMGHALKLVRFLDRMRQRSGIAQEQRAPLEAALAAVLSDATVRTLQVSLDTADAPTGYGELKELLLILGLPALQPICELLGRVEKLKVRKLLVEVLVELGRDDPAVFRPFLNDPRWYLVRNLVLILTLIGTPEALRMILGLTSHREARIRREVLGFLERTDDEKSKPYILKYLRDESSALRIKALQVLARERLPFAFKPIFALAAADDFQERPFPERTAICQALGELGQERAIPMLRELLMKRYWFNKGTEKEALQLALAGLARIRGSAVLPILEEARSQKRGGELRELLDQAVSEARAAKDGRKR
ncbi:HEAT repeat domain-containing protein [Geomonas oryzae]|uniref:HEAT repeat domain-containing protein n=1 Tax=Geomonas oryzae TaxID=2364273 RepID=UPI00100C121D|nr:HEAT repeat domain-containing protein [Geomonas oryzae]